MSVRYREGKFQDRELQAESGSPESFPLVVLINKNSASASEIVAGAIQDHDRGLIVGENSFGKGLVQTIIPLNGGAGLTLTTARYYTPSGRLIQRDYSSSSMYDYFYHRSLTEASDEAKKNAKQWMTDLRRPVFGGGGINPDVKVKDTRIEYLQDLNQTQSVMLSPIFLFTRELVGGQVPAAKDFKLNGPPSFDHVLKSNEFAITDEIAKSFRAAINSFLEKHPEISMTPAQIDEHFAWAKNRVRYEVLLAAYGSDKAQQAMIETDAQMQKAISELPNAAALADRARRNRSVSKK